MLKLNRALASVAVAAVLSGGAVMAAEGIPGLGGPAAPAASGATIELTVLKNGEDGFQIGYPTGWGIVTGGGSDYTFGPTDGSVAGRCFADGTPNPDLPGNDVLLPAISEPIGEAGWTSFMFEGMPGLKYISTGVNTKHPGGWPVQTALVEVDIEGGATIAAIATLKSKTIYQVACIFVKSDWAKVEPTVGAIFDSFKVFKE